MRRIEDSLDSLIFENKHLKNRFSGNGDLKKALELYLNEIDNLYNEICRVIEEGKSVEEVIGFSFKEEYFKAMKKTGNYGRSIRG